MQDIQEILGSIQDLKLRIENLEARVLGTPKSVATKETPLPPVTIPRTPRPIPGHSTENDHGTIRDSSSSQTSKLLGVFAVICFVLAGAFLVSLAIDSGWLTPARQILGAVLFGAALVGVGMRFRSRDASYFSYLPAAGVIVLYVSIAAGLQLYGLYPATAAVAGMSLVSVLSIYLFQELRTEAYGVIATVGTYSSTFLLPADSDFILLITYYLIWDIAYGFISARFKNRAVLMTAAYLALGTFQGAARGMGEAWLDHLPYVIIFQAAQFLVFTASLIHYGRRNQPMDEREAWAFFPVLVFFYGLEYSMINIAFPQAAPWVALAFGGVVYGLYAFAKSKISSTLESASMIYCFLSIVAFHAFYLQILPAGAQVWFGVVAVIGLAFASGKFARRHWAVGLLVALLGTISYVRVLAGDGDVPWWQIIALSGIMGAILLFGYDAFLRDSDRLDRYNRETFAVLCLVAAHLQILIGAYRLVGQIFSYLGLPTDMEPFIISSLWGFLGIATLLWAKSTRDVVLARSAVVIFMVACGKLFLFDVSVATPVVRILCFLITGIVLYASGYLLRKVNEWGA